MRESSGKATLTNFIWKFAERISAQLVSFIVSLVLARLLAPEHYGTIALVNIFITFANVFVSSGFGNALIQKKDSDDVDFSSVFFFSLFVSFIFYAIVFFLAPVFANFYNAPILTPVFRVMGLRLIVAGINSVQHAYVSKHLLFKKFFWSTLGGTVFSGIVGVIMALCGYGIWALVAQYMTNTIVDTVVLFITVKWKPILKFSLKRVSGLFSYGWKLLVSELINTGYIEFRSIVIGTKYTTSDLSFYTKGQSFPQLLVNNINASIQSVLFPVMSSVQDDIERVKNMTRRAIRVNSYIIIPLVIGLALVSEPMIRLLLTEKWLPCVKYLQIYSVFYCFMPLQTANLQAIKAVGRSDLYLKLEIIKKIVGLIMVIAAIPFGVFAIAVSAVLSNIFAAVINIFPNRKLINYGIREQLLDMFNGAVPLIGMIIAVYLLGILPINDLPKISIQTLCGAVVYVSISFFLKVESFTYMTDLIKSFLKKKNKKGC